MAIHKVPPSSGETGKFWAACQDQQLLIQWCENCQSYQFYPRDFCIHCLADHIDWVVSSGLGRVYSYSIVHRAPSECFQSRAPYVVAVIQLTEGVRFLSQLRGCDPSEVEVDMPVQVSFEMLSGEVLLPVFVPRHL